MKYLIALTTLLVPMSAYSTSMYCEGKVAAVYITPSGDVVFKATYANNYTRACNLKGSPEVDTVTCSLWSSYLATAVKDQITLKTKYIVTSEASSCQEIPAYSSAPTPVYVMLKAP